ncbi:RDD family protein [Dactylosporangium sp. CA-092794]|uniref:RDD family protein n=1 Tax=Dactylosporangium sp. CA-092794 TaxID=3239929 RepID=UPI003D8DD35D
MTAPGWYKDPADPDVQRYWDGEGWIGESIPASAPTPTEPPPATPPAPPPFPGAQGRPGKQADQPVVTTPGTPLPQGAVVLPPGTPIPPGGFPPGQLPPGAIVLPPGTPLPPGLRPQGNLPASAVQVLLPPRAGLPSAAAIRPHGHALAPLGARLAARIIDILAVGALSTLVAGWFVYQYIREVGPTFVEAMRRASSGQPIDDLATASQRTSWLEIVILLLIAALWFAYEVPAIAGSGQTFGKRLLKIKVVGLDSDQPLGFGRAIRRWNPLGLSVLLWTCGLGVVIQFIDSLSPVVDWPLRRALHDRSAGTVVVMAEPTPVPASPVPASPDPDQNHNAGEQS